MVCSVIWLFAYSIMRSTKLYTVLGYGAASAAVVQKKFICNIVFLIVIAVAANIVGKNEKKIICKADSNFDVGFFEREKLWKICWRYVRNCI